MSKWIDEGVYADGFDVHAYCCPFCGKHILEAPGHEPRWCPFCGEVVNKAKDDEQDGEVAWECSTCGYYDPNEGICEFYNVKTEPDCGTDCDYWWTE